MTMHIGKAAFLIAALSPSAVRAAPDTRHMAALQEEGRAVFKENCASCHGPGIGNPGLAHKPGTAALQAKYAGAVPALLEQRTDMAPEMIAYFVRNGISVMPMFRKTEVSDAQLRALEAYLTRNSKPPRR